MITKDNNDTSAITARGNVIQMVMHGTDLVWQAVRSCFGKGWWINDKPWSNEDGWKNGE